MQYHDPVRHCRYLKHALSQDNLQIGFFLSAGCPLSVEMPEGKWPLIPDVAGLTKIVEDELRKETKDNSFTSLIDELKKTGKTDYNIEDLLSFIRSLKDVSKGGTVRGLNESQLVNLEDLVTKKISEKVSATLPNTNTPYHKLANWIQSIERDVAIEIFTTNYDLLMEEALEDRSVAYFDGFVGARKSFFEIRSIEENKIPKHWTRLWKLHGSLNWFKAKEGNIYRGNVTPENKNDLHLIYPSHLKYDEIGKMPFLAMLDQLNRFITRGSSILIISGYSFNDAHLNPIIVNSLKSNPSSSVFAFLFKNTDEYPKAIEVAQRCPNLSLFAKDGAYIGTTFAKWAINRPLNEIESSIQTLIKPKGESVKTENPQEIAEVEVSIGDFAKLAEFLKLLIGEETGKVLTDD